MRQKIQVFDITTVKLSILFCYFYHILLIEIRNFFLLKIAEFLSSMSRHEEACEQRIRAAELSPSDYSLAVAAATALRLLDRKNEAEKWYRTVNKKFQKKKTNNEFEIKRSHLFRLFN